LCKGGGGVSSTHSRWDRIVSGIAKTTQKKTKQKKNRVGILVVGKKKEEKRIGIF